MVRVSFTLNCISASMQSDQGGPPQTRGSASLFCTHWKFAEFGRRVRKMILLLRGAVKLRMIQLFWHGNRW